MLAPGGRVVHFLDQSPYLESAFERMAPLGLVVFPNVFADPSASHWPESVRSAGRTGAAIAALLRKHRHPAAQPIEQYTTLFRTQPLPVERALAEFDRVSQDARLREVVRRAFQDAFKLATPAERATLGSFKGFMVSSSKELAARLERELGAEGLSIEHNEFVVAADTAAAEPGVRYRTLTVGQLRSLPAPPPELLGHGAPELSPEQALLEQAVYLFVAKRD